MYWKIKIQSYFKKFLKMVRISVMIHEKDLERLGEEMLPRKQIRDG